jgi:hypothetical protein
VNCCSFAVNLWCSSHNSCSLLWLPNREPIEALEAQNCGPIKSPKRACKVGPLRGNKSQPIHVRVCEINPLPFRI